jgi:hypothetical protein
LFLGEISLASREGVVGFCHGVAYLVIGGPRV